MFRGSGVGDTSSVTLGCNFSFSSTVCVGVTGADCAGIGVDGTGLGGIGVGGGAAIAGTCGAAPEAGGACVSPA